MFIRDFSLIVNSRNLEYKIKEAFKLVVDLTKPKVFWDIGANVGYYSWFVGQYPSLQTIVSFEPDPVNFSLIQQTINRNQLKNYEALNVAVSDQDGEANFVVDKASGATGSLEVTTTAGDSLTLHAHYGMGNDVIKCCTVTIDSTIHTRALPDLLKIDVENAEHLVIAGGADYINTYKPTIIMETSNNRLINQLRDKGYTVFEIDEENFLFVRNELDYTFNQISQLYIIANPRYTSTGQ